MTDQDERVQETSEAGDPTPEQTGSAASDRNPGHGSKRIEDELLDRSKRFATDTAAFDDAVRGLGFQTNQQFNNFFDARGARTEAVRERIHENTLARIRETFFAPPSFRQLWNLVEEECLVILCAGPGAGRSTTARYVLDAVCDARVEEIKAESLGDLDADDIGPHTGYVWAGLRDQVFDEWVTQIDRTRETLRDRGSRMIIISPVGARGWPNDVNRHVHAMAGPPPMDLLAHQVRFRASGEQDRILDVLRDPRIASTLTRLVSASAVVRFAASLCAVVDDDAPLDKACEQAGSLADDLAKWLSGLERPETAPSPSPSPRSTGCPCRP